jgi:hypothetical protein
MTQRTSALITATALLFACAFARAADTSASLPQKLGPNLALKKPYECSDPNKHNWDSGATDGSWAERRGRTFSSGNTAKFPKTLTIDLQEKQEVAHVLVGTPAFGSTKGITVSISVNGKDFTDVGSHDFAQGKSDNHLFSFKSAKTRYVRLSFTGNYAEQSGKYAVGNCFVTEVEVFGSSSAPTQSNLGKAG